jgi:hypothetical protein
MQTVLDEDAETGLDAVKRAGLDPMRSGVERRPGLAAAEASGRRAKVRTGAIR